MALKQIRTDDLTGEEGAEPHLISLDGASYEIDLTEESFETLKELLKPYLIRRKGASHKGSATRPDVRTVREWALARGMEGVSTKGRLPEWVYQEYAEHH